MNCYTYLIGWSARNQWYYGVRYSRSATPSDLWTKYFTSSKSVKQQRILFGEPDIIQIRREFGTDNKKAKLWEEKVLRRLQVHTNNKWLNIANSNSFKGISCPWNKGLTKETNPILKMVGEKISTSRRLKQIPSSLRGSQKNKQQKYADSWRQILRHNPNIQFVDYEEFIQYCVKAHENGLGVYSIATELGVDGGTVKRAISRMGNPVCNQSWSKIRKRYPDFPFATYADFCAECKNLHNKGNTVWAISKRMGLSECTIQSALRYSP